LPGFDQSHTPVKKMRLIAFSCCVVTGTALVRRGDRLEVAFRDVGGHRPAGSQARRPP
jgi:hypothetical protein